MIVTSLLDKKIVLKNNEVVTIRLIQEADDDIRFLVESATGLLLAVSPAMISHIHQE